jgi:spermidine/putrescine transport system permease protein
MSQVQPMAVETARQPQAVLASSVPIRRVGWIRRHDWPQPILIAMTALAFVIMYAPLVIIAILSFSKNVIAAFPLNGFTFGWYHEFFTDPQAWQAISTTAIIAAGALVLSTLIGLPVALMAHRYDFRGKGTIRQVIYMPVVLPGLLNGFVLLNYLILLHFPLGIYAVVIVHGTVLAAVMFSMVYARLARLDPSLEEAAMDLGAQPRQVFRYVTMPILRVSLVGAWLLILMLSLDDLLAAYFLLGQGFNIQMLIWSRLRVQLSPELEAMATVIFAFSVLIVILYSLVADRERQLGIG